MDLYTEAANILTKLEKKQGSVKSLVFAANYKNVRQLYALVCESLKYQPVLTTIFKGCHSLQGEETFKEHPHMATVLLYEHLVGKGLGRAGRVRSCIMKHKREIQEVCCRLLEERGVTSLADLLSSKCQAINKLPIPRYVRVNLLKTTTEDAIAAFTADGWVWQGRLTLDNFQGAVEGLGEERFGGDPLLDDVLIFPPGTDLHDHRLTIEGCVVLQDRASCFPVHVLDPPRGATLLDCCAAPGNKTSHAASVMGNSGKILAYERDAKRMSLLKQQLKKAGVRNTTAIHQDFLSVNPLEEQFADVEYVLVDPSCSGSGIMSRMDHIIDTDDNNTRNSHSNNARLQSLQRFQISILKHALRFPAVRRVVYSTCSIHEEENEAVVREVAGQVQGQFKVKAIFPQFSHRGKGCDAVSKSCVRMSPKKDLTNGFFVACFQRVGEEIECANGEYGTEEKVYEEEEDGIGSMSQSRKKKHQKYTEVENPDDVDRMEEDESVDRYDSQKTKKRKRVENKHVEKADEEEDVEMLGWGESQKLQKRRNTEGVSVDNTHRNGDGEIVRTAQNLQPEGGRHTQRFDFEEGNEDKDKQILTMGQSKKTKRKKSKREGSVQGTEREGEEEAVCIAKSGKTKKRQHARDSNLDKEDREEDEGIPTSGETTKTKKRKISDFGHVDNTDREGDNETVHKAKRQKTKKRKRKRDESKDHVHTERDEVSLNLAQSHKSKKRKHAEGEGVEDSDKGCRELAPTSNSQKKTTTHTVDENFRNIEKTEDDNSPNSIKQKKKRKKTDTEKQTADPKKNRKKKKSTKKAVELQDIEDSAGQGEVSEAHRFENIEKKSGSHDLDTNLEFSIPSNTRKKKKKKKSSKENVQH